MERETLRFWKKEGPRIFERAAIAFYVLDCRAETLHHIHCIAKRRIRGLLKCEDTYQELVFPYFNTFSLLLGAFLVLFRSVFALLLACTVQ